MFAGLTGIHIVIIVAVILVLFGATKLPMFAKGLGQSIKIFRNEVADTSTDKAKPADKVETPAETTTPGSTPR